MTNEGNNQKKSDSNTEVRCWRSPNCNASTLDTSKLVVCFVKTKVKVQTRASLILREFPKTFEKWYCSKLIDELKHICFPFGLMRLNA